MLCLKCIQILQWCKLFEYNSTTCSCRMDFLIKTPKRKGTRRDVEFIEHCKRNVQKERQKCYTPLRNHNWRVLIMWSGWYNEFCGNKNAYFRLLYVLQVYYLFYLMYNTSFRSTRHFFVCWKDMLFSLDCTFWMLGNK